MPKVVVNSCYGGFGLSDKAIARYAELKGINIVKLKQSECLYSDFVYEYDYWYIDGIKDIDHHFYADDLDRTDPALVQVVEELGREADGESARLRIADVPDDVDWYIDDYDGRETVRESARSW